MITKVQLLLIVQQLSSFARFPMIWLILHFHLQLSLCLLVVLSPQGQAAPTGFLADTPEVKQAKAEFMLSFQRALAGLLSELAPDAAQDTTEVKEAKEEFTKIFDKVLCSLVIPKK